MPISEQVGDGEGHLGEAYFCAANFYFLLAAVTRNESKISFPQKEDISSPAGGERREEKIHNSRGVVSRCEHHTQRSVSRLMSWILFSVLNDGLHIMRLWLVLTDRSCSLGTE